MDTTSLLPGGRFDGTLHRFAVRAYFEDTDLSGVVYHANYLRWFERARSDMLRLLAVDQRAAFEAGEGAYAVSEIAVAYRRPARLDDSVLIESRVLAMGAASGRLEQKAFRLGADASVSSISPMPPVLLAEATVRIGFVGPDGRPRRQPAAWREAFARVLSPAAADAPVQAASIPNGERMAEADLAVARVPAFQTDPR